MIHSLLRLATLLIVVHQAFGKGGPSAREHNVKAWDHPSGAHFGRGGHEKPSYDNNPDKLKPGEFLPNVTATFSSSTTWGTWEGWGTSLAWWAARFGSNEVLADLFFTLDDDVELNGEVLPGLGLNIVRYNAGATSYVPWRGAEISISPNAGDSRLIDTFWTSGDSTDGASVSWDWEADLYQRWMMDFAVERGVNRVELFSNSPVWWQCINNNPSGANVSTDNNLQPEYYKFHAIYMATVAKKARDEWGVNLESVDAFNEPTSPYWSSIGTQEGCHFDVETMAEILPMLREELDARGLQDVKISASDETSFAASVAAWDGFANLGALELIDQWNVHGYQYESGDRVGLHRRVSEANKILWESEYGGNDGDGKRAVTNLFLDFRYLHMTAWVYWQVLDQGGWGLINSDVQGYFIYNAEQKYFGLAHFTRHIREGMTILDSPGANIVAAYDAAKERLVIVAANFEEGAQLITFDLSQLVDGVPPAPGTQVRRWVSRVGAGSDQGGERYENHHDDTVVDDDAIFRVHFDVNVLMTFEIDGVVA